MIFVDASAWVAAVDARDGNHKAALEESQKLMAGRAGRLVTTDYVLDESLTLIRKYAGAGAARQFMLGLDQSKSVHVLWISSNQFRTALELFLTQPGRSWSFTDCTSFVAMRELGITSAFTFDRDFREAGFLVEPPSSH
jgi:uncharacterized protein